MEILTFGSLDDELPRARLALLLESFSELSDDREPQRIMYPLHEVLLLVTCATIASCDDFDDIVLWGEHHLDFLRSFSAFHFGVPCARWVRALFNRIGAVCALFCKLYRRAVAGAPRPHRQWLEDREAQLLPVPYYHVVFTLPAAISAVAFQNKAAVYDLLFRTAAETLTTIAADPSISARASA